jgi:spore maturation protein CgeB
MKLVVMGLTVTSSWGNGHATTFRALLKALYRRGHKIVFFEKDVEWYRSNRDMPRPNFCEVVLYEAWSEVAERVARETRDADAVVVGSYFPDAIVATSAMFDRGVRPVLFYDIDTPVTMAGLRRDGRTAYLDAETIPGYAAYMSFTGGPALKELEEGFGSPMAVPLYCSVDTALYRRAEIRAEFRCDLSYLGTYAEDRQTKLMELLNEPAVQLPGGEFLVAGPMYPDGVAWAGNVRRLNHVSPPDHPAFYTSARFTLNLTRREMVLAGYSPSVRLFEAAACGAAMISDWWAGLDEFFEPGEEILVAANAAEVEAILTDVSMDAAAELGRRARERVLTAHTAERRAEEFERIVAAVHGTPSSVSPSEVSSPTKAVLL